MKRHGRVGWAAAGAALLTVAATSPALALAGKLTTPDVAYASNFPRESIPKVRAALKNPDVKFVNGNFINAFSSLNYRGDTKSLASFVEKLSACPDVTVSVSFFRPKQGQDLEEVDFQVSHDGHRASFNVRVNLESKRVQLDDLHLPPVKQN